MEAQEVSKEEIRKEVILELEQSIMVSRNKDGSVSVDMGGGTIKFKINQKLHSMWKE